MKDGVQNETLHHNEGQSLKTCSNSLHHNDGESKEFRITKKG